MSELRAYRWPVGVLAVLGTVLSTPVVGYGDVSGVLNGGVPVYAGELTECALGR